MAGWQGKLKSELHVRIIYCAVTDPLNLHTHCVQDSKIHKVAAYLLTSRGPPPGAMFQLRLAIESRGGCVSLATAPLANANTFFTPS